MKLTIDNESCIGCGACVAEAGTEYINFNEEGFAEPQKEEYTEEEINTLKEKDIENVCPVEAIKIED